MFFDVASFSFHLFPGRLTPWSIMRPLMESPRLDGHSTTSAPRAGATTKSKEAQPREADNLYWMLSTQSVHTTVQSRLHRHCCDTLHTAEHLFNRMRFNLMLCSAIDLFCDCYSPFVIIKETRVWFVEKILDSVLILSMEKDKTVVTFNLGLFLHFRFFWEKGPGFN